MRFFLSLFVIIISLSGNLSKADGIEPEAHTLDVHIDSDSNALSGGLDTHNVFAVTREEDVVNLVNKNTQHPGPFQIMTVESNAPWAHKMEQELRNAGFTDIEVRLVPDLLNAKWEKESIEAPSTEPTKKHLKDLIVSPDRRSIVMGSIITVFRGTVAFSGAYLLQGINIDRAMAYTMVSASLTALFAIRWRSTDNVFAASFKDFNNKVSIKMERIRRVVFDIICTATTTAIRGATSSSHPLISWGGAVDLASTLALFTGAGTNFSLQRARTLSGSEKAFANKIVSFDVAFLTTILFTLKQLHMGLGTWMNYDVGTASISFSTVDAMVLAIYLGGAQFVKHNPDLVVRWAAKQDRLMDRLMSKTPFLGLDCEDELSKLEMVSD